MYLRVVQSWPVQPNEQLHVLGAEQTPPLAQRVVQTAVMLSPTYKA